MMLFMLTYVKAQLPAGFTDSKIQTGYIAPMGAVFNKSGQKMFVWEKKGTLWVSTWNGTTFIKQATPVLDISEEVGDWRDFGFASVALDPNFDTNGLIYLYYQVDRHHLKNFGTPQYSSTTNDYFSATIGRVTRYKLNTAGASWTTDYGTRSILLGETAGTGIPILHESHAGGQLIFGTDGTLLLSTGDGANFVGVDGGSASGSFWEQGLSDGIIRTSENVGAFRAQMLNSHSGKILRMDPATGNGLPSNPYYKSASPRSAQSRVWALGFRNPYRMSLKTDTGSPNPGDGNPGTLFVADVQWDTWEELNVIEKSGLNGGWPLYEGITPMYPYQELTVLNTEEPGSPLFNTLCNQATSPTISATVSQRRFTHAYPAIDWEHRLNIARSPEFINNVLEPQTIGSAASLIAGTPFKGNAATSGTYYAGKVFPPNYTNVYFFADYGANWIKAAVVHDNENHRIHEIRDFAPEGYCNGVVDIEYCPADGSIFYVNINTGIINRISFGTGNNPPNAVILSDKTFGLSPLTVAFNGSSSNDPDGDALTYSWDFGDGTPISTLANPTHLFTETGIKGFTVTLTVTDSKGAFDFVTKVISINNTPPSVKITNPVNNALYSISQATNYTLTANITDNNLTGIKYDWQVSLRHNNHEHREPVLTTATPTTRISPIGCDGETYYYLIELTVTDNGGLTGKDSVKIYPDCNSANINIKNLTATPQANAVFLNWTNPTPATVFDEVMVVAKANTGFQSNPSGTSYVANANFQGNSTPFEGGKVVYRGKLANITVTGLTAGDRYYFRVFTRIGTSWTGGIETSAIPTGSVCIGDGKLYVETWLNIGTSTCIGAIPLGTVPTSATTTTLLGFEAPTPVADNFGMRLRGYVCAPETGDYTFYVAGDNAASLLLSTNTDPVNKREIAFIPNCDYTRFQQWDKYPQQKSIKISLTAGQKYYIEALLKESDGGEHLSVGWQLPSAPTATVQVIPANSLTAFVPSNSCTGDRKLYVEIWSNISTSTCYEEVPVSTAPTTTSTVTVNAFEAPANPADNFGMRLRGYICAPETGAFTFYLSGDNSAILYLSTNADPANKKQIAFIPNCDYTLYRQWTKFPQQKSAAVNLIVGQQYYIEAIFKEGDGGEHLSVGWQKPSAPTAAVQVIPATSIASFNPTTSTAFDPAKCYKLTNRVSNRVLEIPNASLEKGINLQQATDTAGRKHKLWRLKNNGDDSYTMINTNSGYVADVAEEALNNEAAVVQWTANLGNNQRWIFTQNTEGYYKITAKHSTLSLAVLNNSTANGAQVVQATPNATSLGQQWTVAEATCPSGALSLQSEKVFVVQGYRDGKKAVINWLSNDNQSNDYFVIEKIDEKSSGFERLYFVKAQQGKGIQTYSVNDDDPYAGENYYRVSVHKIGEKLPLNSDIVKLDFSNLQDYMLFPNPANDYIDIDLEKVINRKVTLSVMDISGSIVKQYKIESAVSAPYRLPLDGLQNGAYMISIEAQGKRTALKKFVILK